MGQLKKLILKINMILFFIVILIFLSACKNKDEYPIELLSTHEENLTQEITTTVFSTATPTIIPNTPVPTEKTIPIVDSSKLLVANYEDQIFEVYLVPLPCWDTDLECTVYDYNQNIFLAEVTPVWGQDIAPSGDKILFISDIRASNRNGDLFVAKFGESSYHLVSEVGSIQYAIWSPTGNQIAYISLIDGEFRSVLHIVSEDGKNDIVLPLPDGIITYPNWSPFSEKIAFYSKDHKENKAYLYTIDLETNEIEKLSENVIFATNLPVWSPDGKKIAYLIKNQDQGDICIVETETLEDQCFYTVDSWDTSPSWSPNSSKLAYSSNHDQTASGIFIMSLDTEEITKISHFDGYYSDPIWSPDGSYIACEVLIGNRWYVHLIAEDGSWEIQFMYGGHDLYANQFMP